MLNINYGEDFAKILSGTRLRERGQMMDHKVKTIIQAALFALMMQKVYQGR